LKPLTDSEAPPHPGEILREHILPRTGLAAADLARHLDVAPSVVAELLDEKRSVSVDLALRLGTALGQGARYWLGLQALFDIWQADQPALRPARVTPVRFEKLNRRVGSGRPLHG
jgi:addiction module HigA family antidote